MLLGNSFSPHDVSRARAKSQQLHTSSISDHGSCRRCHRRLTCGSGFCRARYVIWRDSRTSEKLSGATTSRSHTHTRGFHPPHHPSLWLRRRRRHGCRRWWFSASRVIHCLYILSHAVFVQRVCQMFRKCLARLRAQPQHTNAIQAREKNKRACTIYGWLLVIVPFAWFGYIRREHFR